MEKHELLKFISAIDKEIGAYEELKVLFEEKRELLKKSKSGDLNAVDNKIIALNNTIVEFNKMRQEQSIKLTGKDCSISEFIDFLDESESKIKEDLTARKVKICKIFEELSLLNTQNVELLKHGIIITDKMLATIVDAFAPQGSNYNGAGKTDTRDLDMWTVNEQI